LKNLIILEKYGNIPEILRIAASEPVCGSSDRRWDIGGEWNTGFQGKKWSVV
jgi:hypothetical protein